MKQIIEEQFLFYLAKMELDITKMPENQITETRRAFYGAFAQCLVLVWNETPEEAAHTVARIKQLIHECKDFFSNEANTHAAKEVKADALDEKGFYFIATDGRIGWCRMQDGAAWFLDYMKGGGWVYRKQVTQMDVWGASQSRFPRSLDEIIRKNFQ